MTYQINERAWYRAGGKAAPVLVKITAAPSIAPASRLLRSPLTYSAQRLRGCAAGHTITGITLAELEPVVAIPTKRQPSLLRANYTAAVTAR